MYTLLQGESIHFLAKVSGVAPEGVGDRAKECRGCAEEGPNLSRQGILTAMAIRFGADGGRVIVSSARDGFF